MMDGKQLRNSILQWAIQGKLVPQDPNDEPASVLLERIREEKARLVKEKKIKRDKNESIIYRGDDNSYYEKFTDGRIICIDEEIRTTLPNGWTVARFGTVVYNRDSERIPLSVSERSRLTKTYDYYGASGVIDKVDRYLFDKNLLLIGEDGANLINRSTPIAFIATGKYWVNNHAHVLDCIDDVFMRYICLYINSISLVDYVTGTAQPKMNQEKMNSILLLIPPYKEQIRILEKVEEVLPFINHYGSKQYKLDVLYKKLNSNLRKSILQEAIQGRLVDQNHNDEPAYILLQRIREEKQRLVKEGKLKKKDIIDSTIFRGDDNKYYEQIGTEKREISDEIPFEIPANWSWCRIDNYVKLVTDFVASGSFASLRENVKYYKTPNYAILVKAQDFQNEFKKDLTYTDKHGYDFLSGSNLFGGELILSNVGSIGKVFIVPKLDVRMSLAPNSIMVKPIYENQIKWLYFLFNSEFGVQLLYSISSATAIRKFNKTSFKKLIIPIPPICEQQRIVNHIERLFNELRAISLLVR